MKAIVVPDIGEDSSRPVQRLLVSWTTAPPICIDPATLFLGVLAPGEEAKRELRVSSWDGSNCLIEDVKTEGDGLAAVADEGSDGSEKHCIRVSLRAPENAGVFLGKVFVRTDRSALPACVRVSALIRKRSERSENDKTSPIRANPD